MIETGISFGNIHSFYDLNLILSSVTIAPAYPKTSYVDIPGADGSLDLTEVHGEVKFYDRTILCTFTMNPSGDLSEAAWEAKKTEVSNLLNGLAFRITLDKDPDYYWQGRCVVDEYKSNKRVRQFVISATVRPYKMKHAETAVSFALSSTEQIVSIRNGRKAVCPVIECTDDNTYITHGKSTCALAAGSHKTTDIIFVCGENELKLSGAGTVTFRFQEGDL